MNLSPRDKVWSVCAVAVCTFITGVLVTADYTPRQTHADEPTSHYSAVAVTEDTVSFPAFTLDEPIATEYVESLPLPAPVEAGTPDPVEDDPAFDCRVHGNLICGVFIQDERYLVTFVDGEPTSIIKAGF